MDSQPPIVVVTRSRQAHEVFMMGYSALFGVVILLSDKTDNPVLAQMDRTSFTAWALAMTGSGLMALTGCFWRQSVSTGLFLEQIGLYANAACVAIFAGFLFQVAGAQATFTSGVCLAWILADVVRAMEVRKDQRDLRRGASRAPTA